MLQLRPNCEYCDKDLPPNAIDARVCSYECTYCARCVEAGSRRGRSARRPNGALVCASAGSLLRHSAST